MNSYRSHQQNLLRILEMLEKGRFISRRQAARLFDCTEGTITIWLNELREDGHKIHYSRSLQKYVLNKKNDLKG
ncbi:helix-turn-helix domain-containing protein [Daejeonella sp.]|uniref:helix-turn-helix domain-containing protein n=1 Tax=Daejeonella sp. TaxID=2805397 RepID=UPI00271CBF26|nr:helix-turn-helix domain-containing protein [Daejeonella sp.]MDO8992218.1 helix-turn-helix domain-containing protein [Daejeonella sp.]MDP2414363.1 helix-turn-helix domain-containing protein [Daejeonella sp.]